MQSVQQHQAISEMREKIVDALIGHLNNGMAQVPPGYRWIETTTAEAIEALADEDGRDSGVDYKLAIVDADTGGPIDPPSGSAPRDMSVCLDLIAIIKQ